MQSVTTSQAIFHLTALDVPVVFLHDLNKLSRYFVWTGTRRSTGASSKSIGWQCSIDGLGDSPHPTLEFFCSHFIFIGHGWNGQRRKKHGVGLWHSVQQRGHMGFFHAARVVHISNGQRVSFWVSSWLYGRRPKEIAVTSDRQNNDKIK